METPLIDHLTAKDYEHIYEPAEDSFLLLDALEADLVYLEQSIQPRVCLEIGAGSGILITALAKRFPQALCLATDINPYACAATKRTAMHNGTQVDSVRCNLVDALRLGVVDVMLFNPPYVVTPDEELWPAESTQRNLVYSWAGGQHGRRVIDMLLPQLDGILSAKAVLYLLLLRENKPEEVMQRLRALKFEAVKLMERRIPGEYLYIVKVTRSKGGGGEES